MTSHERIFLRGAALLLSWILRRYALSRSLVDIPYDRSPPLGADAPGLWGRCRVGFADSQI